MQILDVPGHRDYVSSVSFLKELAVVTACMVTISQNKSQFQSTNFTYLLLFYYK